MSNKSLLNHCALLPLLATGAFTAAPAFAEEKPDRESLETVVVVGVATDTEITPEQLEKQQANDLSDVFRHIPSVSVGGSLGMAQKIYIRGMEDTLLNVTVDGAPQTGTLFHHIGRVSIEPELLERVEVQSGAGEATSGPGAIGGAIRFKTKDANDLLASGEQLGARVKGGYFSNDGTKGSASVYGKLGEHWGVVGSFVQVDRNNMQDGDGSEVLATASDQSLAFIKVSGDVADNQKLTFSYEKREESGELGRRPNWFVLEGDPLFPMDAERETLVANYSANLSEAVNLEFTAYDTNSDMVQDGPWGLYGGNTQSIGFDIRNTSYFGQHKLTYGIERRNEKVVAGGREVDSSSSLFESGRVQGVYVQDHWQVTAPLLVSFGVRYDTYDLEQSKFDGEFSSDDVSPNIGFNYALNDAWTLTAGHAQAVRGKEIGDAFTIDVATIAPQLQAESVANNELALEYSADSLAVKAAVYQSTIDDVIYDEDGFENIGELASDGFELSAAYGIDSWYFSAAYSHNDSTLNGDEIEGYEYNGLGNTRGDTLTLAADYALSEQLELGWNFTHVQDLNNIEVLQRSVELGWIDSVQTVDKPGYQVHDIYLRWQPLQDDSLAVNFAVQNLFDEHYRDHSSVADYSDIPGWEIVSGIYEAGRDVRLSVDYRF
ncbi:MULTISPECIES: TonB-dependent receptor domain-containing protein [Microbulbifer]|uniref:TonB-dependent receptor domain-containing protein n=1 Tax=Microbulbifer celer TaxID=435905 RepID=A0ABW3U9C0_9GAMM|nr:MULTISPECIES: TonB-dependent receptor [Microbulbifer]UFN57575.1 TonB-dependent receptor [Microbulbifer celer]